MAATLLKVTTILSLILPALLLTLNSQVAFSEDIEDDEDMEYVLDSPVPDLRSRSRFLTSVIQEGAFCHPDKLRVCNGVSANKGTCFFQCCKKHCRNVLKDQNNCGRCGKKCKQGERCCNGTCTNVVHNANHCGKCTKKCKHGVKCHYGYCGYA
ncbi:hypothetical protein CJ030_MR4G025776 [Morella rubra]|uniref:Protein GRIM REAPER n=1 Tax=Morella rubra TaxID=262757 RepID=A0A6A1VV75_9ROSI|nr:hypothetical protein CJ030_MR4G025776 [Morella rubra]